MIQCERCQHKRPRLNDDDYKAKTNFDKDIIIGQLIIRHDTFKQN